MVGIMGMMRDESRVISERVPTSDLGPAPIVPSECHSASSSSSSLVYSPTSLCPQPVVVVCTNRPREWIRCRSLESWTNALDDAMLRLVNGGGCTARYRGRFFPACSTIEDKGRAGGKNFYQSNLINRSGAPLPRAGWRPSWRPSAQIGP